MAKLAEICVSAAVDASKLPSQEFSHEDACIASAIKAVDSLGEYVSSAEVQRRKERAEQQFVGIGVEISRPSGSSGPVRIVQPIEHSPAQRAGLLPGDDIIEIDGIDVTSMSLQDVVRNVFRGKAGTSVNVKVQRGPDRNELTISAIREHIEVVSAKVRLFAAERVLYLRVSQFRKGTTTQLAMAVARARSSAPHQPRKVILDLRANSGGLLDEVVAMSQIFMRSGALFANSRDRYGRNYHYVPSQPSNGIHASFQDWMQRELRELPITVLVDAGTASGAELFAQSLKEVRRAKVVGGDTAMYADVQTWKNLPSGSMIKITTAKLTSAEDTSWERTGVQIDESRSSLRGELGDPQTDRVLADQLPL